MKKWMLGAVIVVVALIAAVSLIPAALADGPTDGYGFGFGRGPVFNQGVGYGQGRMVNTNFGQGARLGLGSGGPENSLVAVAAEQLELTRTDLISELQSGQTIADVAAEKGVALDTIVEAFIAPRAEQLAAQVANGQLTQEQADVMLATMRANVTTRLSEDWSPQGPGLGQGFVDEDGDGVCDNAGTGRGPERGPGRGYGLNFVDEDGDGVCDNAGSGASFGRPGGMMGRWGQQNLAN